jgi:hypothetical protein
MFGELPKYEVKIVSEYFSGKRQMDETCYKDYNYLHQQMHNYFFIKYFISLLNRRGVCSIKK